MTDNDSPWKEMLEQELPLALAFCFPEVHADLDWVRDHESLDQELRKLDPGGAVGKRVVDRLVKAWSKDGDPRYLHLEAQGKKQRHLPKRMFDYSVRCVQHFGEPVASFAILLDADPKWRPRRYRTEIYGTKHAFTFVTFKVIDWEGREDELRAHENPVALFVLAQLVAMRTKKDPERRTAKKLELILLLQGRGMAADDLRRCIATWTGSSSCPKSMISVSGKRWSGRKRRTPCLTSPTPNAGGWRRAARRDSRRDSRRACSKGRKGPSRRFSRSASPRRSKDSWLQ